MRVPRAHQEAVTLIRDLSDEAFAELEKQLSSANAFCGISELTTRAAHVDALTSDDAQSVVLALLSLYAQLKFHGWTAADLAAGVARSRDLPETDVDPDSLERRLASLLALDAVGTTGRALDLLTEHEHVFHSARVLTDIRPVFGPNPTDPPNGALIVESLKIDYFDEGSTQSLYLSLSHSDLEDLRDTISRALEKSDTVRELLDGMGLSYFNASDQEGGS